MLAPIITEPLVYAFALALLPIAVLANFADIWLVRSVPTAQFYRITYILLFVLGGVLLWQGAGHLLQNTL